MAVASLHASLISKPPDSDWRPAGHPFEKDMSIPGDVSRKRRDEGALGYPQNAANRHITNVFFADQRLVCAVDHWRRDHNRGKLKKMARFPLIQIEQRPVSAEIRYLVALAIVGATLAVRLALIPYLGREIPFVSFFLAVVISSWFGGFGPGVLATLVSALLGRYVFLNVENDPAAWVTALLFLGQGVLISYLLDSMTVSKRRISGIVGSISDGFAVFDSDWSCAMTPTVDDYSEIQFQISSIKPTHTGDYRRRTDAPCHQ